jgi:mono/diheme cytochrome c family protein
MIRAHALAGAAIAAVLAFAGCTADPVQKDAVSALGKEKGAANETHRAGQPCGVCHQSGGDATSDFSIAGTIFAGPGSLVGVEGARVDLVDSAGTSPPVDKPILTNCVGNFFVLRSDWNPAYPIAVRVSKNGVSRTMQTEIARASSCADCHTAKIPLDDPYSQVTQVYLFADQDPAGKSQVCDRDPDLANQ